ncbi:hypothetical protein GCM10009092_27660 [Bowmanella denitrificans]|uniref:Porin n=1 Tax=Bowmanella denitrificans TaxID=366582 RepID=A0ABN0XDZ6_9ALTE
MRGWLALLTVASGLSQGAEISGLLQVNLLAADNLDSYQQYGTGILREDHSGIHLQQALVRVEQDLVSGFSVDLVANLHSDGEQHVGLSQMQLIYKPLMPSQTKFKGRAGFFYPDMSLENPELGWLSPYQYTQSAINSWLGEELRIPGVEFSLYSPGRQRHSPWSWEVNMGAFRGNDPLGTLLSWRGFALHDRQSLHQDRIAFAPYPSVVDPGRTNHPDWVEPFHEIDGRTGYYAGVHLDYYQHSNLRYYYYDNNADPLAANDQRLYAWHTRFHSLALSHRFGNDTRIIGQWLKGDTEMGTRWVFVNFDAWYLLLSHKWNKHRFSLRLDSFKAREDDKWAWDPNNSDGRALTLTWRYDLSPHWQVGLEHHVNRNTAANRPTLGQTAKQNQQQSLAVVQYRW